MRPLPINRWIDPGVVVVLSLGLWRLVSWHFHTCCFRPAGSNRDRPELPAIAAELGNTLRRAFTRSVSQFWSWSRSASLRSVALLGLIVDPILEFLVTIRAGRDPDRDAARRRRRCRQDRGGLLRHGAEHSDQHDRDGASGPAHAGARRPLAALLAPRADGADRSAGSNARHRHRLRLGVTASLLVTITSEMLLSTNGIGAFVQRNQESFYVASGLAGIVAIAIMGLIVNLGLRLVEEKRLLFRTYCAMIAEE